jgi:hypothetical protein
MVILQAEALDQIKDEKWLIPGWAIGLSTVHLECHHRTDLEEDELASNNKVLVAKYFSPLAGILGEFFNQVSCIRWEAVALPTE